MYNILAREKEAERVLYRDEDPQNGFVLLPDLKWDQTSMNAMVSWNARSVHGPLTSGS